MRLSSVEYVKGCTQAEDGPKDGLPEIAFIGRSNVGKSSLINFLLGRKIAHTSSTPGKTQLIHFFRINKAFYFVDLPGYGYARTSHARRAGWAPMIEDYLERRKPLRGGVFLVDIRHLETELDSQMKTWLDHRPMTTLLVATKGDKISRGGRPAQVDKIKGAFNAQHVIVTSTQGKEGKEPLWKEIRGLLQGAA